MMRIGFYKTKVRFKLKDSNAQACQFSFMSKYSQATNQLTDVDTHTTENSCSELGLNSRKCGLPNQILSSDNAG